MHANQSTVPWRLSFSFQSYFIFFSDWCSVDSGSNNATWSLSALSPRLWAKWLIMCKQTFTCTRDLLIKKSSGAKAFVQYPLCKEKKKKNLYFRELEVPIPCFLKVRILQDKQSFWSFSLLWEELWPLAKPWELLHDVSWEMHPPRGSQGPAFFAPPS